MSNPPIHDGDSVTVNLADAPHASPDPGVNYTTKELIARVDVKIDGLYTKLDSKVDQAEFVKLKTVVDDLSTFRAKAFGAIAVIGMLATAGLVHPL